MVITRQAIESIDCNPILRMTNTIGKSFKSIFDTIKSKIIIIIMGKKPKNAPIVIACILFEKALNFLSTTKRIINKTLKNIAI